MPAEKMPKQCKPAEIFDLEEIVRNWAMQMFDLTKTRDQAKIPKEHLQFTISWKRVKFVHKEPEYPETPKSSSIPKAQILFRTIFCNNTDQDQEYTFKTERSTCSICEINLDRCLTLGQEVSLSLKTPCEVFEANAGFKRELTVSEAQGQCIEETLTWGVESIIKVPAGFKTTAELEVFENELSGDFTVVTEFAGKVIVSVTNIRDNNSFVKSIEGDISEIIKPEHSSLKGFSKENKVISFTTKGSCHFRFAFEQHVTVRQQDLD